MGHIWVWDARLTSVLTLFFLYLGYIALYEAFNEPARGARAASILCLVGSVNLPIIKFSVDWWYTLHQPASILCAEGPAIHPSMLTPLAVMWLGFLCYFVAVHILRTRAELTERRIRNLRLAALETALRRMLSGRQSLTGLLGHRDVVTALALPFADDHLEFERIALPVRRTSIIPIPFINGDAFQHRGRQLRDSQRGSQASVSEKPSISARSQPVASLLLPRHWSIP